jgi:uncharacterized beta-barrel protein YwiB (DUF1934 family)
MEKPVIISIRGVQSSPPNDDDVMELVTQGTLWENEDNEFSLSYRESELTGLEGTTTTFHIGKKRITLLREGTYQSEMIFEEGQNHLSTYETPYGGLMLGVSTRKARSNMDLDGGDLEILYDLEVDDELISKNSFVIHVTEPTADTQISL